MTGAVALLDALRAHGVRLRVVDDERLGVYPWSTLDGNLREAIRREKAALIRLLSTPEQSQRPLAIDYEGIFAELTAGAGTADDLPAIDRHARLNGFWVAEEITQLDRRCDVLAQAGVDTVSYRAAVLLLVARVGELRRWQQETPPSHAARRLTIERNAPVAGPVWLDDGTTVNDVDRFIGRLLTAVEYVLAWSDGTLDEVLGVYLDQLAALGVQGRVAALG